MNGECGEGGTLSNNCDYEIAAGQPTRSGGLPPTDDSNGDDDGNSNGDGDCDNHLRGQPLVGLVSVVADRRAELYGHVAV